ncbi:MFS transporter [Embleya scabrispora]|nr:MFS transporter [Embleya scabrispora]
MCRVYALVTDLAPSTGSGRYLAVFGTGWGIAATLAPLCGTQLLARTGAIALWSTMAALCLLLAATHLRTTPRPPALHRPSKPTSPGEPDSA